MAHVTLKILPNDSDPTAIGPRLGVEPTRMVKKGELAEPGMLDSAATESAWSLSTEAAGVTGGIGSHVGWLMQQLGANAATLKTLQDEGLGVSLQLQLDRGISRFSLSHALLTQLQATGLDVEVNLF